MPRHKGCADGNPPSPISVGATGKENVSAKVRSSSSAPAFTIPPPTYNTGRLALSTASSALAKEVRSSGETSVEKGKPTWSNRE
jgi:hypothetical protein